MIVPTARVTDTLKQNPRQNGIKIWGLLAKFGSGALPPLPTPVVAPLGIIMSYKRFNWSNLDKHD